MSAPETITTETTKVTCDGGKGELGHPLVYLNMGDNGRVDCPYCGREFVLKEGVKVGADH